MARSEPTDSDRDIAGAATDNAGPAGAGSAAAAEAPPAGAEAGAAAKKEAAENYDRYLRAVADLENFRRRAVREKEELRQFASAGLLEGLLPVLDNLALGLLAAKQPGADVKQLVGGVEMVMTQLKAALTQHGLTEINPAGQRFDPHQHEAISHQEDGRIPEEHVLQVVRPGYSLNGRLLRPASVVVSSGPAKEGSRPA